MAERKATNKYYPPDWDPLKGSVNRHTKSHPLRDRARKIDEGILVVRFEMPFNIWCLKCDNHIGMGVRYNAEKSKVGSYYTSPIYKFKMKCHLCDNYFVIQTDPSKFDYFVSSGARKQVRELEADAYDDSDQVAVDDEETKKRKMADPMFRLERKIEDEIHAEEQLPGLHELKQSRSRWEDSFAANQLIRSQFRQKRKRIEQGKERDKRLLQRASLKLPLVKSSQIDKELAKVMFNQSKTSKLIQSDVAKRKELLTSDILTRPPKKGKTRVSNPNSCSLPSSSEASKIKQDSGR